MQTERAERIIRIQLNVEQTKKFLSFFIPEAIEIAKKRMAVRLERKEDGDS
jgi:hypothetical protein